MRQTTYDHSGTSFSKIDILDRVRKFKVKDQQFVILIPMFIKRWQTCINLVTTTCTVERFVKNEPTNSF